MNAITTASVEGVFFIDRREGFVSRTYLCPAGVPTIGNGFTMGSKVFAAYWMATRGHALRMGDTITREESRKILRMIVDEEYGRAVARTVAPEKQHHFDGASSMALNCGTGALNWRWAKALAASDVKECGRLLRTTGVTANGRRLQGLVNRRELEARLIEVADYALGGPAIMVDSVSTSSAAIKEYQGMLAKLGYYKGKIDGFRGDKTDTAIETFQRDKGLKIDGVVGPATRAALIRALDAKATNNSTAAAATAGGGGSAATDQVTGSGDITQVPLDMLPDVLMWGAVAVGIVLGAFLVLRYRGKLTGRRVPT